MTRRIFSGMQPTNRLHLGNYLGALKNWVVLQRDYDSIFCIVDLHALTVPQEPGALAANTRELAAAYIAAGIDPDHCTIFPQSAIAGHSELAWILACHTPMGWLNRMTQFKEKAGKKREEANLGLYAYPTLMAADILLYKATHVPVGDDQKQHLELSRDIAQSFNQRYGTALFPLPEPQIMGAATRVMSLRNGAAKMSKSDESDYSRINLTDDADTIALKFRKAKTDPEPLPESPDALEDRPEARNLVNLYAALANTDTDTVLREFSGQGFGAFKPKLAELAVSVLAPISARLNALLADPAEIDRLLARGAERARTIADPVLDEVKRTIGLMV